MLYKTIISYFKEGTEKIQSGLGVKLHGAMMNLIPKSLSNKFHQSKLQPFSICCIKKEDIIIAKVCALTDSAKIVCDVFADSSELEIFGMDTPLVKICSFDETPVSSKEAAESLPDKFRLNFITPAAIRQNKIITCTPSLERYFYSTAEKYALFENADGRYDEFCRLFSRLRITDLSLSSENFNYGGNNLLGITGHVDIDIKNDQGALRRLISYAAYSGIGLKAAMGMGGIEIEKL